MIENETWMVRPGFVHAPGPAVTIEIQFAQVSIPVNVVTRPHIKSFIKYLDSHLIGFKLIVRFHDHHGP